jgi:hypothetical protein
MTTTSNYWFGQAGAYEIDQSLRFNSADSAYLNRTPGSSGSTTTWTISTWVKRASLGAAQMIWSAGTSGITYLTFNADDTLKLRNSTVEYTTNWKFRDPSAWYHIIVKWDTTNGTQADRAIIYVNGVALGTGDYSTYDKATSSEASTWNSNVAHNLGRYAFNGTSYLSGYLAEINFIDGSALTPSSFGETDTITGAWIPKRYTGTYGTNGFYLKFADNSGTTSTTLGKDSSGNSNNWTPNNFSVTAGAGNDVLSDTPTTNYATFNPVDPSAAPLSEGNLKVTGTGSSWSHRRSTFAMTSGKWYWENTVSFVNYTLSGVVKPEAAFNNHVGQDSNGWGFQTDNGKIYNNSSGTSYGSAVTTGTVLGFAFDADTGKMWVRNASGYYNSGDPVAGTNPAMTAGAGTYFAAGSGYQTTEQNTFNFGQTSFAYTPPTGYKALNTANLPEPTIKDGGKYFNTVLYTGNSSTKAVSGVGFSPDLVWIKARSTTYGHYFFDAVRGTGKYIMSNNTNQEVTDSTTLSSFNADGFSLGAASGPNNSGDTYVAWNWDAGGAGSSNNAGTITSTVSANPSAGFSIVTWTGTGADGSYGHGLGVKPAMIIHKRRNSTSDWHVWHQGLPTKSPTNDVIYLNLTDAQNGGNSNLFRLDPTSSVIYTGSAGSHNVNGATYVDYVWSEVAGYSKFGSYVGNGSSDGPFVYTGHRSRFILYKRSDVANDWYIMDTARDTYNVSGTRLFPNLSNAEYVYTTTDLIDVTSNGFKIRSSNAALNASGGTYIFMALAENPFGGANTAPANAR